MKAFTIQPNGTQIEAKPKNGKYFSLEEMQGAVGGYVEPHSLPRNRVMMVDEDGKSKGLTPNLQASALLGTAIVGTVLVMPRKMLH